MLVFDWVLDCNNVFGLTPIDLVYESGQCRGFAGTCGAAKQNQTIWQPRQRKDSARTLAKFIAILTG